MSLLLQALQKAAKNREAGIPPSEPSAPPPPTPEQIEAVLPSMFSLDPAGDVRHRERARDREPELTLAEEDLFEPDEISAETDDTFEPFEPSAPSTDRAATILRASEAPSAGWLDRIRDRPVHAFAACAGIFAVFYGGYLYLQIFQPAVLRGEFFNKPLAATKPAPLQPATRPITPANPPAPTASALAPATSVAVAPPPSTAPASAQSPAASVPLPPSGSASAPSAPTSAPTIVPSAPPKIAALPATTPSTVTPSQAPPAPILRPDYAAVPPRSSRPPTRIAGLPTLQAPVPRIQRRHVEAPVGAVQTMEEEISSNPAQPPVPGRLAPGISEAYQALQAGRLDKAESLYRGVIQADEHNIDAMLGLAAIAMQRSNSQQAIGFYERALELEPRNPVAQAGLITIIGQADPQMSETRLKQLIAREPSAFLHFSLGNVYAQQEQWPAAQQAYFQAYEMQPDNPDYAYNLAIGLEHLGQSKLALTYYRKALDISFHKGRANFDQKRVIERIGQLSAQVD